MKLYATVTSERASKGQGGNKQLNIAIYIDDRENPHFRMFITRRDDESTDIVLTDMEKPFPNQVFTDKLKGKKQKGEMCYTEHVKGKYGGCSVPHYHN